MGYNRISSVRFTERMIELLAEVEHVARSVLTVRKRPSLWQASLLPTHSLSITGTKVLLFRQTTKFSSSAWCIFLIIVNKIQRFATFYMVTHDEILLKDRIRHLLNLKKVNFLMLADGNETLRARYGRQVNNVDTAVPYTTIHKLLNMFPDISADWLVMGEGSMRKADCLAPKVYNHNQVTNSTAGGDINVGVRTVAVPQSLDEIQVKDMQSTIAAQQQRISELENDKQLLQGLLTAFTKK